MPAPLILAAPLVVAAAPALVRVAPQLSARGAPLVAAASNLIVRATPVLIRNVDVVSIGSSTSSAWRETSRLLAPLRGTQAEGVAAHRLFALRRRA